MFGRKNKSTGTTITTLTEYFEAGMEKPYLSYSERELLEDACKYVGVFTSVDNRIGFAARTIAIENAGSCVGGMEDSQIKDKLTAILRKCCTLDYDEILTLSNEEKQFIKAGIEGRFYRAFYEI